MDFRVAEPISRRLGAMLAASDLGYPSAPVPAGLATIFAHRMHERFDWQVDPERVEVLTDVVQGLHLAIAAFSEPGDALVTPMPIYPPFLEALHATKRVPVWQRFVPGDTGYRIDFDRLREELRPDTRMLLVCNPHNPTGRALGRDELESLATIAIERDLVVVSDEIHADLVYPGSSHVPIAKLGAAIASRTVTLTSATKAFNIAGLRCAVAVFGSAGLQRRFARIDRHIRGGLNSFGLAATEAAWTEGQPWQDEVVRYLESNRDFVATHVRENWPEVGHFRPEATYLSWLDFRSLDLAPTPRAFFAEKARVVLAAGEDFGDAGRGFARLNFATSRTILSEILERMNAALGAG
jgi:cysteine-S-conjugate beta-lyase